MLSNGLLKNLPKENIFVLVDELREASNEHSKIKVFKADEVIFKKGQLLDGLYLPIDQPLELQDGSEHVGYLNKGRTLSILALIEEEPLAYDVIATENVKVLFLPREKFLAALASRPDVKLYLKYVTLYSSIRSFKNFLSNLELDTNQIVHVISSIRPIEAIQDSIIRENLIFVERGIVSVTNKPTDHHIINVELGKGSFFGGAYYPPPHRAPYDYKAAEFSGFSLSHEVLRFNVKKQEVLDKIVSEPWLNISQTDLEKVSEKFKTVSAYEFKKVSLDDLTRRHKFTFDLSNFRTAKNDFDGNIALIYNSLLYLKKEVSFEKIRQRIFLMGDNISAFKISTIYTESYLDVETYAGNDDHEVACPYLTFMGNRAILVMKKEGKQRLCFDSIHGMVLTKVSEIEKHGCGEFLSLRENLLLEGLFQGNFQHLSQKEKNKEIRSVLFEIIFANKPMVRSIFILSGITFALAALVPFLSQILLDEVLKTSDKTTLYTVSIGMLICYVYIVVFSHIKNIQLGNLGLLIDKDLSALTYRAAFGLKQSVINAFEVGGVINRMGEMARIREFFSAESINTLINMVSAVFFIFILAAYSWEVALLPIVYGFVVYGIRKYLKAQLIKLKLILFNLKSESETFLANTVSTINTVKAFGAEASMAKNWDSKLTKEVEREKEYLIENSLLSSVNQALAGILQISGIWLLVYLSFTRVGAYSPGVIFAISQYLQKLIAPINGFITFLVELDEVEVSLEKVSEILFGDKIGSSQGRKNSLALQGKVKLDRVSFKFPETTRLVLQEVSLTIFPGQIIAFVGRSGSGKTTLANIISGDQRPVSGKVFYDDMDSDSLSSTGLKNQIGFIQQSNELFAGSIRDNIAFDDDVPNEVELEKSAQFSNSDEFLEKFPQKYDTYISEGGMGLSGGQKQRISISKIIYKKPKILIFDEATSALDSQTEKIVLENIKKSSENATVILIAHRLSTIKNADYIYVIEEGQIAEQGSHKELIKINGLYTELFKEQFA